MGERVCERSLGILMPRNGIWRFFSVVDGCHKIRLGANEYLLPSSVNPIKIPLNAITLYRKTYIAYTAMHTK